MRIHRLLPDDEGAWGRFEDFQYRVRDFVESYTQDVNLVNFMQDVRERWVKRPLTTGYWLVYDDAGKPIAHNLSWIDLHYGTPFVSFVQTEIDDSHLTNEILETVGGQIGGWVSALNRIAEMQRGPRITYGESWTWIKQPVYERLFKHVGFELKASRTVFRWTLVRDN